MGLADRYPDLTLSAKKIAMRVLFLDLSMTLEK